MAPISPELRDWLLDHGYPVPDEMPDDYAYKGAATGGVTAPAQVGGSAGGSGEGSRNGNGASPDEPAIDDGTFSGVSPPYGTYDPALEAQRRALERGFEDTLLDTQRTRHRARRDYEQQMRDLETSKKRGLGDIKRERKRGTRDIAQKRGDVQTQAARGREDFGSRLGSLIHNYQVLAGNQYQQANARGTLAGSTLQAGEVTRAGNFARARQPLDTGLARLNEDETRSLTRLGTAQTELQQDTHRAAHELRQDVRHDTRLGTRDLHRTLQDISTQRQRARREATIGEADVLEQEAYQAHELHPGTIPRPTAPPAPSPAGGGGGGGGGRGQGGGQNRGGNRRRRGR